MNYDAVMLLAKEKAEQIPLVVSAHNIVLQFGNQFSGSSVVTATPGVPANQSLVTLLRRGIVEKTGEAKKGHRGYYRLVDPPGVERALRELGRIP